MRKTMLLLLLCSSLAWSDTLIMRDGSRHHGVFENTNGQYLIFKEGGMPHRYLRSDVQSIEFNQEGVANSSYDNSRRDAGPANYNDNGQTHYSQNRPYNGPMNGRDTVTLPEGTQISVLTDANIDSQNASEGQLYPAEVAQDVLDSAGNVVIPKDSEAQLTIRNVNESGGVSGSNDLSLALDSVNVNGNTYRVSTEPVQQGNPGLGKNKRTGEYVGGGAVLGTLIGAIAGGGKGAAIGAIAGAGAGAGAQVLTRGKEVKVPAETTLNFQLDRPLHLQPE